MEYLATGAFRSEPNTYMESDGRRMRLFQLTGASLWARDAKGQWQKAKELSDPLPCVAYDDDAVTVGSLAAGTNVHALGSAVRSDYIGKDYRRHVVWTFAVSRIAMPAETGVPCP